MSTQLLAGVAGACLIAGLILGAVAVRGVPVHPGRPPRAALRRTVRRRVPGTTPVLAAGGVAVGLVVLAVTGWPVAALGGAAGVAFVPPLLHQRSAQRLIDRLEALAVWTRRIADLLASGAGGLDQAVIASARTAPEALRTEITTMAARARVRGLEAALRAFADDVADPAADRVVASLILRTHTGGSGLVTILNAVAASVREEVVARRQVEADRAKPRSNMRSIVIITAVVAAGLVLFARTYLAPFSGVTGQLVLAVIVAIFAGAFGWMHHLARPRTTGRFLDPTRPGDKHEGDI